LLLVDYCSIISKARRQIPRNHREPVESRIIQLDAYAWFVWDDEAAFLHFERLLHELVSSRCLLTHTVGVFLYREVGDACVELDAGGCAYRAEGVVGDDSDVAGFS